MVALHYVIQVGLVPKALQLGNILLGSLMMEQPWHAAVGVILFPKFVDGFGSIGAELLERQRINPHLIAAIPEDGADVGRQEMRVAASDVNVHIVLGIQAVNDFLEAIHLLHFVKNDVIIGVGRGDADIK